MNNIIKHEFVEHIPDLIEENFIYISIKYSVAVHNCVCGCGNEVVTPFSQNDWNLTFNGECISIHPSIGNCGFLCRSHYWIKKNKVIIIPDFNYTKSDKIYRNKNRKTGIKKIFKNLRKRINNLKTGIITCF